MGRLTEFAAERQRLFDAGTSAQSRKERGHFGTPAAIAEFMAAMFSDLPRDVRILDPGAGVGMLSAAVCERALTRTTPARLYFELWENDPALGPHSNATMSHCREALRQAGHEMEFVVKTDDFILANGRRTLFDSGATASFNWAILNPPYFKLRKESPQARAMEHVVHGQPNIYALFMAAAADALVPGGRMVAITPRSYFNGPYFERFRKWLFDRMTVRQIHSFESRKDAFREDSVLQENVILHAEKAGRPGEILLSTSRGRDLSRPETRKAAYRAVIDDADGDHVVRVTTNDLEHEIVETLDSLPHRFRDMGLAISTGPVVTFRSTEFLRDERASDTAPLLWMHNVRRFVTQFPPKNGKPTHIEVCDASKRLLLPAKTYVLLKRFTSKEEKRRLVAGILQAADSYAPWVGLENHLNYVYRRDREISTTEAFGLAAYFNSALVDRYFRSVSGNTQVNATEIRSLPMPDEDVLHRIGQDVERCETRDLETVERIVGEALRLPSALTAQLHEAAT